MLKYTERGNIVTIINSHTIIPSKKKENKIVDINC